MRETLPTYMYRDPAIVLEQKQENELKRSCAGCVHVFKVEFKGAVESACSKGRMIGKRCKLYERGDYV